MAKVYLHGFLQAFDKYRDAVPILSDLFDQVQNAFRNLSDENMAAGGLSAVSMADGVALVTSAQYVGDGTVDRVISLSFTPRYVHIYDPTDQFDFWAIGLGIATGAAAWHRNSTGAHTQDGAGNNDWQGIVTNGFKLGHLGTGKSNVLGQTYTYVAYH